MNLPGFTGEVSLYRTRKSYYKSRSGAIVASQISPQIGINPIPPPPVVVDCRRPCGRCVRTGDCRACDECLAQYVADPGPFPF